MDRRHHGIRKLVWLVLLLSGCQPTQPYFLHEDGDLSHYLDKATEIEYPDVDSEPLPDAIQAHEPYTLVNAELGKFWDLSLEEAVSTSLANSKVVRSIAQVRQTRQVGQGVATPPESLSLNADFNQTIYDVAIAESGPNGVETALANFDAQWNTNLFWDRTDRPQNVDQPGEQIFARILERDFMNFESELTKRSITGTQWSFRNITSYDSSNRPLREVLSEWFTSFEAEARHPLMRGGGTMVNRVPVLLARIRTDQTLIVFNNAVRDLLIEVERAYWDLYFYYRNLETAKVSRDSALGTWKRINAMYEEGGPNVSGEQEAQAREQYFLFRGRAEEAKRDLLKAERQLRYLMGIAPTDGRIIRPSTEPTLAKVEFDWHDILTESLVRSPEVRQRKWEIKRRELELVAARNNLLPQADIVALYRWLGLGDDLLSSHRNGANFPAPGSLAWDELSEGRFAEWRLGFDVQVPLGNRAAMAGVRHQQLQLARARALKEDLELEISHGLTDAVQNLDASYALAWSAFLQRAAARRQVEVLDNKLKAGTVTLEFLLDAQRRAAEAERAFYQAALQYNLSILEVHYRKGSLLEYCGVTLEEGPWPAKAYFDTLIRARQRDASYFFNYGYSRPGVISQGPVQQTSDDTLNDAMEGFDPSRAEMAEPVAPGPVDSNDPYGLPNGGGEPIPEPADASDQLRSALRFALPTDADEGPVLNRPTTDHAAPKFEWDAAFE